MSRVPFHRTFVGSPLAVAVAAPLALGLGGGGGCGDSSAAGSAGDATAAATAEVTSQSSESASGPSASTTPATTASASATGMSATGTTAAASTAASTTEPGSTGASGTDSDTDPFPPGSVVPAYCRPDASAGVGSWAVEALPEAPGAFPYGFGVGDVDASGAVFWTEYEGSAPGLRLALMRYAGDVPFAAAPDVTLAPDPEGLVHELRLDLEPCADYRYAFVTLDGSGEPVGRSAIGTFTTPPLADAKFPVTFVMSGDTDASNQPFSILDRISDDPEVAFFIYNGDLVYSNDAESDTLPEYRDEYRRNWQDPHLQRLFRTMPIYAVWDDHDVRTDWNATNQPIERIEAGWRAMTDYAGIRRQDLSPGKLYRAYQYGSILDVIITDSRSEVVPGQHFWSPEQVAWLQNRLTSVDTTFKFIVMSVPIGTWFVMIEERLAAFPEQRAEVLGWMGANQIANAYWLSADHHAWIGQAVPEHGGYAFTAGPVGAGLTGAIINGLSLLDPTVFSSESRQNNYLRVTADPTSEPPQACVEVIGQDGSAIFDDCFVQQPVMP
jgi:alkaline phosphatase D